MELSSTKLGSASFAEYQADRNQFQKRFVEFVCNDPNTKGRMLDVGCGDAINDAIEKIYQLPEEIHGVDTIWEVANHPKLARYWCGKFEEVDIPSDHYDMALSYNVVEHIDACRPFLESIHRVLKPGGSFWCLTPHGNHPFCRLSRLIETIGFKNWFASRDEGVNDYPAYYRLNRESQVLPVVKELGFSAAEFYFHPCTVWDRYFPSVLKVMPHLYDRLFGLRYKNASLIFIYKLVK